MPRALSPRRQLAIDLNGEIHRLLEDVAGLREGAPAEDVAVDLEQAIDELRRVVALLDPSL
ncbi:MAG: hypothetical protein Q8S13_08315 [Dehalococcoidia bacterium]|nr:hypothetical protein [Dehalococcoidia bacterium]